MDHHTTTYNRDAKQPLQSSLSPNDSDHFYDIVIIGGGMCGVTIARDVASAGYTSLVLEKQSVIGGVWSQNNYAGLRLHGLAHCYRCASLAPGWQRKRRGQQQHNMNNQKETHYRPCRDEIMEYIEEMASHPKITLGCSMEYIDHARVQTEDQILENGDGEQIGHQFEVKVRMISNSGSDKMKAGLSASQSQHITYFCRAVVFATGNNEMATGPPNLPIDPSLVRNGAAVMHSSELAQRQNIFEGSVDNLYVIGSSKASIDVLNHFLQLEQSTEEADEEEDFQDECAVQSESNGRSKRPNIIWCHRGHCLFVVREHLEGWATSSWLPLRIIRKWAFAIVFWLIRWQWFRLIQFLALLSGVCARAGKPLTSIPMRGGIESRQILRAIGARYGRSQRILDGRNGSRSIKVDDDGVLQLPCADGNTIRVGSRDAVCFCTGQSQLSDEYFYPTLLNPSRNKDGVFSVQVYCQVAAVNAVLTALWVVQYLDGVCNEAGAASPTTAYSTGRIALECKDILEIVQSFRNRHPWAVTTSYFATSMAALQRMATPGIVGDLSFDYRWRHEWFGTDLDVHADLAPFCVERGRDRHKKEVKSLDNMIELTPIV